MSFGLSISDLQDATNRIIDEFSCDVTVNQTGLVLPMLPDEDYEQIRKSVNAAELDKAQGRLVLFAMRAEVYNQIPIGATLTYDGETFSLNPSRAARYANLSIMVTVLGAAGGYS